MRCFSEEFLGLRPLAGYASLKLCHAMSCFVHEKRILCYDMAMLPTLTPDNAGDAGFLGPSRAPTQKADMGSRARAPEDPRKAAQKERPATARKRKRNKTLQIAAKRTEQQPNDQRSIFWRYLQRFGERGPSITGMPGSAWRQNAQK